MVIKFPSNCASIWIPIMRLSHIRGRFKLVHAFKMGENLPSMADEERKEHVDIMI